MGLAMQQVATSFNVQFCATRFNVIKFRWTLDGLGSVAGTCPSYWMCRMVPVLRGKDELRDKNELVMPLHRLYGFKDPSLHLQWLVEPQKEVSQACFVWAKLSPAVAVLWGMIMISCFSHR